MFKIPKWEDDVPKSNIAFGKAAKHKKEKNVDAKSPAKTHQNVETPDNKKKKLGRNKLKQKSNNNIQVNSPQPVIKLKETTSDELASQNGNKKSRKRKRNNVNSADTSDKTQNTPEKRNKAKKRKLNNIEGEANSPQPLINLKETTSKESATQNGNKKSRKHKRNNVNSADTVDKTQKTEKKNKAKKRKLNNIEGEAPKLNIAANNTKTISNGNSIQEENVVKPVLNKIDRKKEKFRKILQMDSTRNHINVSGNNLRQRMLERLKAAQFRFLNEKLYTTSGSEAQKLFQSDPDAFHTYHQGYQLQLKKWPVNPLDLIVKRISKMPKTHIVADMGCGEASLSKRVPHQVRSFDLVAAAPGVEACDMARTPLLTASVDVAVYCLALMGTELTQYLVEANRVLKEGPGDGVEACNMARTPLLTASVDVAVYCLALMWSELTQYLVEANRVLKEGAHLLIAEVESRFDKVESFTEEVQRLGFKLKNLDKSHQVFFFMEFLKVRDPPAKKSKLPVITLKPCLYKRR